MNKVNVKRSVFSAVVLAGFVFLVAAILWHGYNGFRAFRAMTTDGANLRIGDMYQVSVLSVGTEHPTTYGTWGWEKTDAQKVFDDIALGRINFQCPEEGKLFVRLSRYVSIQDISPQSELLVKLGSVYPDWVLLSVDQKEICRTS